MSVVIENSDGPKEQTAKITCYSSFYPTGVKKEIDINIIYDVAVSNSSFGCSGSCAPVFPSTSTPETLLGNFTVAVDQSSEDVKINKVNILALARSFESFSVYLKDENGAQISNTILETGGNSEKNYGLPFNLNYTISHGSTKNIYVYYTGTDIDYSEYVPSLALNMNIASIEAQLIPSDTIPSICMTSSCRQ
jgi:hypothetical protein